VYFQHAGYAPAYDIAERGSTACGYAGTVDAYDVEIGDFHDQNCVDAFSWNVAVTNPYHDKRTD
jgi:hypothetical protein